MGDANTVSRRHFLSGSGAVIGGSIVRLGWPAALAAAQAACSARDEGSAFLTLTAAEAREIDAFAARILPTTSTPGAREAGVIHFFDNVLGGPMAGMLDGLRGSLAAFQDGIAERFPGATTFSDLEESDQDAWISENESSAFFRMGRMLTLIGFFAMSKYGGNRDNVAWELIGFDGHGAAQPPFGYYDAAWVEEKRNGD